MQIIDQHKALGDSPHIFQNAHAIVVRQMMKKRGSHYDVECIVAKWQLQGIANNRRRFPRQLQSSGIAIQYNDPARNAPDQSLAGITSPSRNIENERIRHRGQEACDGTNPAEPSINHPQLPIGRVELMLRAAEIVHDLVFVRSLAEIHK